MGDDYLWSMENTREGMGERSLRRKKQDDGQKKVSIKSLLGVYEHYSW